MSFEDRLRQKRREHFLKQEKDAAGLPEKHIWAFRAGAGGSARIEVPLRQGLGAEIMKVEVEADGHADGSISLRAEKLKNAIASQVCGNSLVFDLCYDSSCGPMASEVGSTIKLLPMEKLKIHMSSAKPSESPEPNLSLLFCGEPKVFETHDNGGRPFKVGVTRDHVSIHANCNVRDDGREFKEGEAPLIAAFTACEKVFVGISSGSSWCDHPVDWGERFGNSILVCLAGGQSEVLVGSNPPNIRMNFMTGQVEPADLFRLHVGLFGDGETTTSYCTKKMPCREESAGTTKGRFESPGRSYVFVGDRIYIFQPPDDDEIVEYYSMIGRSDVPYPVAVGKKYIYFMLDMQYVPRSAIKEEEWLRDPRMVDEEADGPRWEDAYCWFYGRETDVIATEFPRYIALADRQ